jgi:hypothetical protein
MKSQGRKPEGARLERVVELDWWETPALTDTGLTLN